MLQKIFFNKNIKAIKKAFIYFGLFFGLFVLVYGLFSNIHLQLLEGDSFWLIKTGENILQTQKIPKTDIFSWTAQGKKIIVYQWLFELFVGFIHLNFGLEKLVKLFAYFIYPIIFIFIPYFYLRKIWKITKPIILQVLLMPVLSFLMFFSVNIRPQVFTFLFLILQYIFLDYLRLKPNSKSRKIFIFCAFSFMYIIWANSHTGVFEGLTCIFLFFLGDLIQSKFLLRDNKLNSSSRLEYLNNQVFDWKFYLILFSICFLSSLVNPYGFEIYQHLFEIIFKQKEFNAGIGELGGGKNTTIIFFLSVFFVFHFVRYYKILSLRDYLPFVFFLTMSLFACRFFRESLLILIIIIPKMLQCLFGKYYLNIYKLKIFKFLRMLSLLKLSPVLPIILAFICLYADSDSLAMSSSGLKEFNDYKKTTEILNNFKPEKIKLFNDCVTGDYLIFNNIKHKITCDTRFDFYGNELCLKIDSVLDSPDKKTHEKYFKKNKINAVLVSKKYALSRHIENSENYKILYNTKNLILAVLMP